MQIDTWNRDKMQHPGDPFVPGTQQCWLLFICMYACTFWLCVLSRCVLLCMQGPVPNAAQSPPDAHYAGILECPFTDRIFKRINASYATRVSGSCGTQQRVWNASDCFQAVHDLIAVNSNISVTTRTVHDTTVAPGCSYSFLPPNGHPAIRASFNTATKSTALCGEGVEVSGSTPAFNDGSAVSVTLVLRNSTAHPNEAHITLLGPATVWFGVGFNATEMSDLPYTIVIDGTGKVSERKLGNHAAGDVLSTLVQVISNTVSGGVRTVELTRPLLAESSTGYYSFDLSAVTTLPLITAIGSTVDFGYHRSREATAISLSNMGAATCVCATGIRGEICGNAIGGCIPWNDHGGQSVSGARCPVGTQFSELAQLNNPTCNIQQYQGGLACCHHLNILTDEDQNPWPEHLLQYRLKFRFYFEEYSPAVAGVKAASHQNLVRFYWQTESFAGEYDVPKGGNGDITDGGANSTYTIHSSWKVQDMIWNCDPAESSDKCTGKENASGINIIYAGGHCHAPSCLGFELWNADTNTLLCRQTPVYGKNSVGPVRFQEDGYVALPPCLWGHDSGLAPPVFLGMQTNLRSVKVNNATYGHYGEMASWQMRGVLVSE